MILGLNNGLEKFKEYAKEDSIVKQDSIKLNPKAKKELTNGKIEKLKSSLDNNFIPEATKNEIIKEIEKEQTKLENDSLNFSESTDNDEFLNMNFGGNTRLDVFSKFQKTHEKMPVDVALDSLGYEHTFWNRFWYDRAKSANTFAKSDEGRKQFLNQALSYGSIALFVFLPIFTLFLKLVYIRRKFTYVDHLVFVFHCQTVFFMLLSIFFLVNMFVKNDFTGIFILLFLLYLFIALKVFYNQGYVKTIFKFILLNLTYLFISIFGIIAVLFISFALF